MKVVYIYLDLAYTPDTYGIGIDDDLLRWHICVSVLYRDIAVIEKQKREKKKKEREMKKKRGSGRVLALLSWKLHQA